MICVWFQWQLIIKPPHYHQVICKSKAKSPTRSQQHFNWKRNDSSVFLNIHLNVLGFECYQDDDARQRGTRPVSQLFFERTRTFTLIIKFPPLAFFSLWFWVIPFYGETKLLAKIRRCYQQLMKSIMQCFQFLAELEVLILWEVKAVY